MRISVVIPTLNEGRALAEALRRVRETAAGSSSVEIIVADGGSQDGSEAAASGLADKFIVEVPPGRARQMHRGAREASGDLLLFLHADTRLPEGWAAALESAWAARPRPCATAFSLRFDRDGRFYRLIARAAAWRNRLTGIPLGDQALAVSKDAYFQVGGFPPVPLMEEYFLIGKLKRLGPVRILREHVITSARRYEKNGRAFQALRNLFITVLFYLGIPPRILAGMYR